MQRIPEVSCPPLCRYCSHDGAQGSLTFPQEDALADFPDHVGVFPAVELGLAAGLAVRLGFAAGRGLTRLD